MATAIRFWDYEFRYSYDRDRWIPKNNTRRGRGIAKILNLMMDFQPGGPSGDDPIAGLTAALKARDNLGAQILRLDFFTGEPGLIY